MNKKTCTVKTICPSCGEETFLACQDKCLKCGFTIDSRIKTIASLAEQVVNHRRKKEAGV